MGSNVSRDSNRNSLETRNKSKGNRKNSLAPIEEKKLIKPTDKIIQGRTYHAIEGSSYMLPRDDLEIDRLHDEHFVTKELLGFNIMSEALKTLDFYNKDLKVLDVCCGPATWLCETSLEYPNCQFTGIDMCTLWPQIIRPVNLTFTEANILQGIPFPDKSFDFIQMRFVVLAFKSNEWPLVISEIKRVLKDGGCFQCIEMDMRVAISDKSAQFYTETFESFCNSYGLDASAAAKLDLLLTDGGMKILQSEYREVPLGWGGPIGDAYLQIFQGTLDGLSPWLKQSLPLSSNYPSLMNATKHAFIQSKAFMGLYAFLVQKPYND